MVSFNTAISPALSLSGADALDLTEAAIHHLLSTQYGLCMRLLWFASCLGQLSSNGVWSKRSSGFPLARL